MRTLKEIDVEVFERAKVFSEKAFGDKYREMYAALQAVDDFLNRKFEGSTGGWDEADAKANLKKLLEAL